MTWIDEAILVLNRIQNEQSENIERAAEIAADAIGGGGVVHTFGTGHSRIPVEEMFPRYGSFPGFHPIVELSMTFHTEIAGANGQRQAMFIERVPGLAEVILSNFKLRPTDATVAGKPARVAGASSSDAQACLASAALQGVGVIGG